MRDRYFISASSFFKFSPLLLRLKLLPTWVVLSLAANVVLLMTLLSGLRPRQEPTASAANQALAMDSTQPNTPAVELGERRQLTYQQWLNQLKQEAKIAAEQQPSHLTVLAGDSISLWFPNHLLPTGRSWLNQAISGETSSGLLKRLDLFDQTKPETIFVMIGINDLLHSSTDQALLENQRQIIQELNRMHPQAQIVVQSILPHAENSAWEGRDRLLKIPNSRVQELNRQLEKIARQEGSYFLDLYPLFANPAGALRTELTTDGLHLSPLGYQTWSIALQVYSREVLGLNE